MTEIEKQPNKNTRGWKPGQSGNPAGRPKKEMTLVSLIKDELDKVPEDEKSGKTNVQLIAEALMRKATSGNAEAIKIVLDRVEGKVKQVVGIENEGSTSFVISFGSPENSPQDAQETDHDAE